MPILIKLPVFTLLMLLLTACGGGGVASDPQQVAVDKIASYADNGQNAPIVEDYVDAGVTGVNQANIGQINQVIEALDKEDVDSQEEIQAIADEYGIIIPPDITSPVITVLGNNPVFMTINDTYTDAGATAIDDRDGMVTVMVSGSVDSSTLGTYQITYTASDNAGNSETQIRTVEVLPPDTTSPIITIIGENPVTVFQGDNYEDAGATAVDDRDSTVTVIGTGNVDTSTIGVYIIAYDAKDSAGNEAQTQIRTINVVQAPDTMPPVVTILGDNPLYIDLNSTYIDAGAEAVDDRDNNVSVTITGTVNTSTLGTYVVAYTAMDSAGNSATETRTVHVLLPDTTSPVITVLGENPVNADVNESYLDAGATAIDDRDGNVPVIVTGSVDTSMVGTYVITYTAKDSADNNSSATRTVNVIEAVNLVPIANAGVDIVTKEGETLVFDASASTDDGEIVSYQWYKGNVKLGDGELIEVNASEIGVGKYFITLRVEDDGGLADTDLLRLTILQSMKKTGQHQSYNEDGVEIEDGSLHDDGYYQQGVTPRYTRDDQNETVVDNITGLMWQDNARVKKVWLEIDKYEICTNDTASQACFDTSDDTAEMYCADINLSGYEDWRLPSVKELQRIVSYDNDSPSIDTTFVQTNVGYYWTGTSVVNFEEYSWAVNFEFGDANGYLKGGQLSVRCVRETKLK